MVTWRHADTDLHYDINLTFKARIVIWNTLNYIKNKKLTYTTKFIILFIWCFCMQQTLWMVGTVSMVSTVSMVGNVTMVGTVSIVGTVTTVTMVPTVLSGTINYFYFNLGVICQNLYFKKSHSMK